MRKASLGSEGIGGLIENLPQMLHGFSEQLHSVSILMSACMEPVTDDHDLQERMAIIDELYSCAEDIDHVAIKFADLVTDRVYEYEKKNRNVPNVSPSEALSYCIKERGLRQADLKSVASQSIISELINGKRVMNIDQVKGFAAFFDVPVETFMGT